MKKWILLLLCLLLAIPAHASDGAVTYSGDAGEFIFAPGSEYSLTDLFPNFKNVMPGDTLTQPITVRNAASNQVKVKIYIRAKGAQPGSEDFLSQLHLTVRHSAENEMAYMFDATADQTAQLTDWVCLGTLYSGGEVNLDVTLQVPVTMGNEFQDAIGFLDWEFMIEEFPVDEDDPKPPAPTGDDFPRWLPILLVSSAGMILFLVIFVRRKRREEESHA